METSSTQLAFREENPPVIGELPLQRPVTQSFGVFFDLRLNKRLSKPSKRRWFETPLCSLWRHCYDDNEANIDEYINSVYYYAYKSEQHIIIQLLNIHFWINLQITFLNNGSIFSTNYPKT